MSVQQFLSQTDVLIAEWIKHILPPSHGELSDWFSDTVILVTPIPAFPDFPWRSDRAGEEGASGLGSAEKR